MKQLVMKLVATYGEIAFQEEQEIIFSCIILSCSFDMTDVLQCTKVRFLYVLFPWQ